VCVSASTVVADDPALTVRDASGVRAERQPLRVVLVRETLPPADAKMFTDGAAPTLVLASNLASLEGLSRLPASAGVLRWEASEGFHGAWHALAAHGIGELLVEAGPRLLTAILAEQALDELTVVSAGGMGGPEASGLFLGEPDRHGEALSPRFSPAEAGIVSDVSVTVWSASARSHAE
jgi:diaminohydroxyphosphoribosylaminopyrimidine deaminase/5-amino-6-(5-phosphoribosylamino)uracil reductase